MVLMALSLPINAANGICWPNKSFGLVMPIINKAIEADAVRVMIPLSNLGIFNTLFKKPVIMPQTIPTSMPRIVAKNGLTPLYMQAAVKAAPKRKLPSAVISAKLSNLNVRKTPIANKQQGNALDKMLRMIFRISIV